MKAHSITFERLVNTGNYTHKKIGITLILEDGEKAADVLEKAKEFVQREIDEPRIKKAPEDYNYTRRHDMISIIDRENSFSLSMVDEAKEWLKNNPLPADQDDLPF